MLGRTVVVADWAGGRGHVVVDGERWNAVASTPLAASRRARIVGIDGLTLIVSPDDSTS